MKTVCICGGGSLGHVVAGYLGAKENVKVNILTRKPEKWEQQLEIETPEGDTFTGKLHKISSNPQEVIAEADIVLLCLPGFAIKQELENIKPYVSAGTYVGSVFSSTGFFFEAMKIFGTDVPLWGFQRVPLIARTKEYGKSAHLLGYKPEHNVAVENSNNKEEFKKTIEELFDRPVKLLKNYYEASFNNSNPILHPSRLYDLFATWNKDVYYDHQYFFYREWTDTASENLIALDKELFKILSHLPVSPNFLKPILEYYESYDAASLTAKIRSIEGFKNVMAPMVESEKGWQPDLESRYFQEDFFYGLRFLYEKARELNIDTPTIDKIYNWGTKLIEK